MRKLEFVTVSVDYPDFLAFTLPVLLQHFDHGVVVTSSKDVRTQAIVRYYNCDQVKLVITDEMYADGAKFNKGKAINKGLEALHLNGWVAHIDADVILPPHMRQILQVRYLDREAIYGLDRRMCKSFEAWLGFLQNPLPINEKYYLVQDNEFETGARVAHYNQPDGWMPIGFFQLWHPKGSGVYSYPEVCPGADHSDIVFAKKFPLGKRHFLAETFVIHLESERAASGINWQGRKTREFRPAVPEPRIVEVPVPVAVPCPEVIIPKSPTTDEIILGLTPLLEQMQHELLSGYRPAPSESWWSKSIAWLKSLTSKA